MKYILILLMMLCMSGPLLAQHNVVTSGGDISGPGGSVSFSIGQIDCATNIGPGGMTTEGNQQSHGTVASNNVETMVKPHVSLSPNPTSHFIVLRVTGNNLGMNYQLLDIYGRPVKNGPLTSTTQKIDMSSLSDGAYYVKISDDAVFFDTLTIIKN